MGMGKGSDQAAWEQQIMGEWKDLRLERQANDPEVRAIARNVTSELITRTHLYVNNVLILPGQDRKKVLENLRNGVNATVHNTLYKLAYDERAIRKEGVKVQVDLVPPSLLQEQLVPPSTLPGDRIAFGGIVISVDGSGKAMVLDPRAEPLPTLSVKVTCRLSRPIVLDDSLSIEFNVAPKA